MILATTHFRSWRFFQVASRCCYSAAPAVPISVGVLQGLLLVLLFFTDVLTASNSFSKLSGSGRSSRAHFMLCASEYPSLSHLTCFFLFLAALCCFGCAVPCWAGVMVSRSMNALQAQGHDRIFLSLAMLLLGMGRWAGAG